jgi:signal transduction histidine kinase
MRHLVVHTIFSAFPAVLGHGCAAALVVAAGMQHAQALDPGVSLASYHHTIWTSKDGAPAPITTIAQTKDGWLWLGTPGGLYRFDGVKFSKFMAKDGVELLSSRIGNLFAQPDGRLIVGYIGGGLSAIDGDKLVHLATRDEVGASLQTELDTDGSLWAATMRGLFRIKDGKRVKIDAARGFPSPVAQSIVLDQYGRLWAGTDDHQYLLDRKTGRFVDAGVPGGVDDVVRSPDGRVWRESDGQWQAMPLPPGTPLRPLRDWQAPSASGGVFDHDGNHWATGCPVGLCRTTPQTIAGLTSFRPAQLASDRLDQPWQMSSLTGSVVFEDREHSIWVGTHGGLERFRNNNLIAIPMPPGATFYGVVRDEAGQALVSTGTNGYLFPAGATSYGPLRMNLRTAVADDGGLFVADQEGVTIHKDGRTRVVKLPADAQGKPLGNNPATMAGRTDDFWLALAGAGFHNYRDGKWTPASARGLPSGIRAVSTDGHGATWFGFRDGSVARLQGNKVTRFEFDARDSVGDIRYIEAKYGVIVAGDEALAVRVDGAFRRLRTSDPELLAGVSGVVRTADGDYWLNGRKGVVHATASAWAAALASPGQPLDVSVFGVLDGYPGSATAFNPTSTAIASADGKLWFSGTSGVAWLDPQRLHRNMVPPALHISALQASGARAQSDGSYALPAGSTTLRFDYTALSLAKPELVRFRYQLDGVDEHWQNAGTRRSVLYTNLGPGAYRFRVMATNEDGVDSTASATMRVTIAPTVFQTPWFKALCVMLLAGAVYLLHRWRMRRLARRYWERLQERLQERERIARALHDNVIQNFQGLILHFNLISDRLAPGDATKTSMDGLLAQAAAVMTEARQEITELRSHADDPALDIGDALAKFGSELQAQFGPRFQLIATGGTSHLTTFAWNEIHAIGREAIFNAYLHAQATSVEVEIGRAGASFVLLVRDDGRGIDAGIEQAGAREGHWGLPGMRERALGVGGTVTVRRRLRGGTEVALYVRARRVYSATSPRRWWQHPGFMRV